MNSLKEILIKATKNKNTLSGEASNWLIEHGYIKTDVYGWEKPEYLEMFGLNPNDKSIPTEWYDETDTKVKVIPKKDAFGKKTNEYETLSETYKTGKKILSASRNYFEYKRFKKELYEEHRKQKYAKDINTPPIEYYLS